MMVNMIAKMITMFVKWTKPKTNSAHKEGWTLVKDCEDDNDDKSNNFTPWEDENEGTDDGDGGENEIVAERCKTTNAVVQTVRLQKKSAKSKTTKKTVSDEFYPRRDPKIVQSLGKIHSDHDIWVERFYKNKNGVRAPFFRSVRTKRCVKLEPPTGAGTIVLFHEVSKYPELLKFATEHLDVDLNEMEEPDFNGPSYREGKKIMTKGIMEKKIKELENAATWED